MDSNILVSGAITTAVVQILKQTPKVAKLLEGWEMITAFVIGTVIGFLTTGNILVGVISALTSMGIYDTSSVVVEKMRG